VLTLRKYPAGLRLAQAPAVETAKLRTSQMLHLGAQTVAAAREALQEANVRGELLEIEAEIVPEGTGEIGFQLRKGASAETLLGFDRNTKKISIDRTRSGVTTFSPDFSGRHGTTLRESQKVKLHVFLDRSSLEVFVNDGEVTLTERIYPPPDSDRVELYSTGSGGRIASLTIWKLGSVWQ